MDLLANVRDIVAGRTDCDTRCLADSCECTHRGLDVATAHAVDGLLHVGRFAADILDLGRVRLCAKR